MTTTMRETTPAASRAFPWSELPTTTRAEADAVRALRRWADARVRLDGVARAIGDLVTARIAIGLTRIERSRAEASSAEMVGLALADAMDAETRAVMLEVEPALAAEIVARGVRRIAPRIVEGAQPVSGAIAGALAAILAAGARRAHRESHLRVLAAGPASAVARAHAGSEGERLHATFAVMLDDAAYLARASVPFELAARAAEPAWNARALLALGEMPLAVPVVACATQSTVAEVATLRRGDAWMPGEWPLARGKGGALFGPLWLAAPASERGVRVDLGEDDRLVLRGDAEELAWAPHFKENDVSDRAQSDALIDAVGEVPIVVRVEIGVAEMRAREWAALGRGDVIALGKKIGEHVTLRVGGVAVAKGELVEIDGEVGVRILGRTDVGDK